MAGRGNIANLQPFTKGDGRARDAGRAGGLRSAQVRADARALADWAAQIGSVSAHRRGGMSNAEAVVRKLYAQALRGSLAAARLLMELTGELRGRGAVKVERISGGKVERLIITLADGEGGY